MDHGAGKVPTSLSSASSLTIQEGEVWSPSLWGMTVGCGRDGRGILSTLESASKVGWQYGREGRAGRSWIILALSFSNAPTVLELCRFKIHFNPLYLSASNCPEGDLPYLPSRGKSPLTPPPRPAPVAPSRSEGRRYSLLCSAPSGRQGQRHQSLQVSRVRTARSDGDISKLRAVPP